MSTEDAAGKKIIEILRSVRDVLEERLFTRFEDGVIYGPMPPVTLLVAIKSEDCVYHVDRHLMPPEMWETFNDEAQLEDLLNRIKIDRKTKIGPRLLYGNRKDG